MTWVLERQGSEGGGLSTDGVLRCRGIPFGTAEGQVREFFDGFEIVEGGVVIPSDAMGRYEKEQLLFTSCTCIESVRALGAVTGFVMGEVG